jgi:hypothetical protein
MLMSLLLNHLPVEWATVTKYEERTPERITDFEILLTSFSHDDDKPEDCPLVVLHRCASRRTLDTDFVFLARSDLILNQVSSK